MPREKRQSPKRAAERRVCFVTGTRAEFGLMRSTLRAIRQHPRLKLQLVATGMHLDPAHGRGVEAIRAEGWTIAAVVPWPRGSGQAPANNARNTGRAMAGLADAFDRLKSDIVLVVGDRTEAFAAAAAAHVSGRLVAHVHGGDRALGQVDDALRHAISKLAHVHFPATAASAQRLAQLGEDAWRIRRVGSPGVDGIVADAAPWGAVAAEFPQLHRRRYALLLLHPVDPDPEVEHTRAQMVLDATRSAGIGQVVIIHPNNDPGAHGIMRCWQSADAQAGCFVRKDVERSLFLGLLRDSAVLVGNSSSGIIEAASFRTPVVDIGPRQQGRQRGANVVNVPYRLGSIRQAVRRIWNSGQPRRAPAGNLYGSQGVGRRTAQMLAAVPLDDARLRRKLIAY